MRHKRHFVQFLQAEFVNIFGQKVWKLFSVCLKSVEALGNHINVYFLMLSV